MHPAATRLEAVALVRSGHTVSAAARQLALPVSTVRDWVSGRATGRPDECPRCTRASIPEGPYAALLDYYLGDGCISNAPRHDVLRISCDARLPGIIADVSQVLREVRPAGKVFHVSGPGTIVVQGHWKHWTCLFPQHGPGRKHERSSRSSGGRRRSSSGTRVRSCAVSSTPTGAARTTGRRDASVAS